MAQPVIRVTGIREVNAALKSIGNGAEKDMGKAFKPIAERIASTSRGKMPSITGSARKSVTSGGTQRGAHVSYGGAKAPHTPWLEFGGSTKATETTVRRPFVKQGRYIWPTIMEARENIEEAAEDVLLDLATRHGFDVVR